MMIGEAATYASVGIFCAVALYGVGCTIHQAVDGWLYRRYERRVAVAFARSVARDHNLAASNAAGELERLCAHADRGTEQIDCLEIWLALPAFVPPHERGPS